MQTNPAVQLYCTAYTGHFLPKLRKMFLEKKYIAICPLKKLVPRDTKLLNFYFVYPCLRTNPTSAAGVARMACEL